MKWLCQYCVFTVEKVVHWVLCNFTYLTWRSVSTAGCYQHIYHVCYRGVSGVTRQTRNQDLLRVFALVTRQTWNGDIWPLLMVFCTSYKAKSFTHMESGHLAKAS